MPFVFAGFARHAGTSKKTGNQYDMPEVVFLTDATQSPRSDCKESFGLSAQTLPYAPGIESQMRSIKPLSAVNFDFEPDPRNMRNMRISGVRLVEKVS